MAGDIQAMHTNDPVAQRLRWPVITIDFEASSLCSGTYPIEVGLCRWTGPDRPLEGWSTLIRPTEEWIRAGAWSPDAERVHGISKADLADGLSPADAIMGVAAVVGSGIAYADSPMDAQWGAMLATAAKGSWPGMIADYFRLVTCLDSAGFARTYEVLRSTTPEHRALPDAERLMRALVHGSGLPQPPLTMLNSSAGLPR